MTYKGYAARVKYSEEDGGFLGHVAGIANVVDFHREAVAELRAAFEEAVKDYLEASVKIGRNLPKPYSGLFCTCISQ